MRATINQFKNGPAKACESPVDTRRPFNVYKMSIRRRRRRIDVL